MSNIPQNLYYTSSHEWLLIEANIVTIGITDYAQHELGDLVFIQLPEVGNILKSGSDMVVVESVKAASDVCAPLTGEVIEVNKELAESPQLVNESAFDSWMVKLKTEHQANISELLTPAQYSDLL